MQYMQYTLATLAAAPHSRRVLGVVWCSPHLYCLAMMSSQNEDRKSMGNIRLPRDKLTGPWLSTYKYCPCLHTHTHTHTHMYTHFHYDVLFLPHKHNNVPLPVLHSFELQNKSCPVRALSCIHSYHFTLKISIKYFKRFCNVQKSIDTSGDISLLWPIIFLWRSEVLNLLECTQDHSHTSHLWTDQWRSVGNLLT